MSTATNDLFYSRLPVNEIPLGDLLMEEHLFFNVPPNWHVIITDVKKSTEAVRSGKHETVNLVATGSIVAVLNIVYKENLSVPFFFGGDGATFIVPPSVLTPVMQALATHRENTQKNFNLALRVGSVAVEEIYANGHTLRIGKLKTTEIFSIPVLLGEGLSHAERIIKGDDYQAAIFPQPETELDLSGMQCRWDKIKPPQNDDEVISLLVIARDGSKQAAIFKKVMDSIDRIYGEPKKRTPISAPRLKLKGTLKKIGLEMRTKLGNYRPLYLVKTLATTLLGQLYFRTPPGKTYLHQLVNMSDTLVIDGKINTVISGTAQQREQLTVVLNSLEEEGHVWYGLYVSKESVMSCYVRNMHDKHVHFVDGSEGGYTRAATLLKKKLGLI